MSAVSQELRASASGPRDSGFVLAGGLLTRAKTVESRRRFYLLLVRQVPDILWRLQADFDERMGLMQQEAIIAVRDIHPRRLHFLGAQ